MVAELTRLEREGVDAPTLGELAGQHGVSADVIARDLRALTLLGDHVEADWLLSLRVWQQGSRVSISSGGPFRRPVRLSPEEQLAIQVALALDPNGPALAKRLAAVWAGRGASFPPAASTPVDDTVNLVRQASRSRCGVLLEYAGEGERESREWIVHPHQVVESHDRTYVVAWAPAVNGWRHFRADRVITVRLTDSIFDRRDDFIPLTRPGDVFRTAEPLDEVRVRCEPEVARWVAERYPEHEAGADGSVVVRFRTTSPEWLARRVLEFGSDAEVLDPPQYRDAVRRAIA